MVVVAREGNRIQIRAYTFGSPVTGSGEISKLVTARIWHTVIAIPW